MSTAFGWDEKEYKDLIHRLSRIEGQVRGIREMVESDRYCVDLYENMVIPRSWPVL